MNSDNFGSTYSNIHLDDFNHHTFPLPNYSFASPFPLPSDDNNIFGEYHISDDFINQAKNATESVTKSTEMKRKRCPTKKPKRASGEKSEIVLDQENYSRRRGTNSVGVQCKRPPTKIGKTTAGQTSSRFCGVTRYPRHFEAFLWDNSDPQVKGKTATTTKPSICSFVSSIDDASVYIGGFHDEVQAARAHDLVSLKYWGVSTPLNFHANDYMKELEEMQAYTKKDYLLHVRRTSACFSKGQSKYRGVSKYGDNQRWQARLGKGKDTKGLYVGSFDTQVEAARAYDIAVIKCRGRKAVTNFDLSHYDVKSILESPNIPIEKGASKFIRWNAADDIIQSRRTTANAVVSRLQVNGWGNPNLTPIAPLSFELTVQALETNPEQQLTYPPLNPNKNNDLTQINQFSQCFNNLNNIPCYQNTNIPINPSFDNWGYYGGHEQIESLSQFQPIMTPANQEPEFHQYNNDNSLLRPPQNPISSCLQDSQNPNCQESPNVFNEFTNLQNGGDIGELSISQEQAVTSTIMMGMDEGNGFFTNTEEENEAFAEDFRADNPDLDISSSSWLEAYFDDLVGSIF